MWDMLGLIWFRLGSHHSSGKALFVRPWKLSRICDWGEAPADRSPEQSTEILQIYWTDAHTDLYAFQLGHKLFPYIDCNKYVCVCVFGGQSNPTSMLFSCMGTHCSVSSSYCTYWVCSRFGAQLVSVLPVCFLLLLSNPTNVLGRFDRPKQVSMLPTCRPDRTLMLDLSIFSLWNFLSSRTQAEILRPRVLTSKGETEPGWRHSLYSGPTDLQGQNKADKINHAVWLPHGLLNRWSWRTGCRFTRLVSATKRETPGGEVNPPEHDFLTFSFLWGMIQIVMCGVTAFWLKTSMGCWTLWRCESENLTLEVAAVQTCG